MCATYGVSGVVGSASCDVVVSELCLGCCAREVGA